MILEGGLWIFIMLVISLSGFPFDRAQGGESIDDTQNREIVVRLVYPPSVRNDGG